MIVLYELKYKLSTLERHVSEVKEELEKLNSNAFLMFTKDFDLKKTVVLVSIIVSILSSPSIVSNFFQSSNQKYTPAKLDKLIELLEEQEK